MAGSTAALLPCLLPCLLLQVLLGLSHGVETLSRSTESHQVSSLKSPLATRINLLSRSTASHQVSSLKSPLATRINLLSVDIPPLSQVPSLNALHLGLNAISGTWCPCGRNASSPCKGGPFNVTNDLLRLRPTMMRTHDSSLLTPTIYQNPSTRPWGVRVFNWDSIYPDITADPTKQASYNFTNADLWKAQFDNLNIPLLLRLGSSVNQGAASTNISMSDVDNLSTAFLHFVKHFNDGWGGRPLLQHTTPLKIQYIEVWNEPEGAFWTGTIPTLHALLQLTISKIRAYDASLYVGPNSACPYGDCTNDPSHSDDGYEFDALDAIINMTLSEDLLPNVYSWHEYIEQYPTLTNHLYNITKHKLMERNFSHVQQIITEWNPCAEGSCLKPTELNSWAAADFGQTVMVHALLGVNVSMPYPLCAVNKDWGLVSTEDDEEIGQSHMVKWRPQAFAFEMMSSVLRETPYVFSGAVYPETPSLVDQKYLGVGFVNTNRTKINVVYVARMSNSSLLKNELRVELNHVGVAGATFQVACSIIDDKDVPVGETKGCTFVNGTLMMDMTTKVQANGSVTFPFNFVAVSPSLLRLRLVQVWDM